MPMVTVFKVQDDRGQELIDRYILPISDRLGARVREAPENASPRSALRFQATSDVVLWDCTVTEGHVYRALNNWVKTSKKNVILSRTPLPRNVLTHDQCAPIHGQRFTNEDLGEWLDKRLPAILGRQQHSSAPYASERLASHYWMYDKPAQAFLSHRGSVGEVAHRWKRRLEESGTSVRIVPPNELAYPTECVTTQQMWEGVARLMHEIRAIQNALIFLSDDYFDSFWTSSELLAVLWLLGRNPRTGLADLREAHFIRDFERWQSFREGMLELAVPRVGQTGMDRFAKIINNSDPVTAAPETQVPPRGFAKLLKLLLEKRWGYYDPEFATTAFWHTVRVPCPTCKPNRRSPHDVDWDRHLAPASASPEPDYFGYFPVEPGTLDAGSLACPKCRTTLRLVNRRGVRTLWMPVMTTEKDQDRPVLREHKVWEVLQPGDAEN